MAKTFRIELEEQELGQLLDGLESRAKSWERTADYIRTESIPDGELFLIEECSDSEEARSIACHYRSIIERIHNQMEAQL